MSSGPRLECYAKPILDRGILGKRKNPSSIDSTSNLKHKFFIRYNPSHFSSIKKEPLQPFKKGLVFSLQKNISSNSNTMPKIASNNNRQSQKAFFAKTFEDNFFHSDSRKKNNALKNHILVSRNYKNGTNSATSRSEDSNCSESGVESTIKQKSSLLKSHSIDKFPEELVKSSTTFSGLKKKLSSSKVKTIFPESIHFNGFNSSPSSSDFSSSSPILKDKNRKGNLTKNLPTFQTKGKNICSSSASEVLIKDLSLIETTAGSENKLKEFAGPDSNISKPKTSKVVCTSGRGQKPRWQRQDLMVYMALCSIPGQIAKRAELLKAAVELDIKIAKEKGIPRTFSGKTPTNSASACLTTNKYNLFSRVDKPGSRFQYFALTFPPGDFEFAVKKYKEWETRLYEKFYPLYFSKKNFSSKSLLMIPSKENAKVDNTDILKNTDQKTISPILIPSPTQVADAFLENKASESLPISLEALTPSKSRDSISPLPTLDQITSCQDIKNFDSEIPKSWKDVLEVKTSSIPGAGSGLFATRFIPAQSILGYYFGTPMTEYDFDNTKDQVGLASHYSIMYQTLVLDATNPEGLPFLDPDGPIYCPFHFMNEHPVKVNAAFLEQPENNQIACVTTVDILPGQELFVFYGIEFEREHYTLDC